MLSLNRGEPARLNGSIARAVRLNVLSPASATVAPTDVRRNWRRFM